MVVVVVPAEVEEVVPAAVVELEIVLGFAEAEKAAEAAAERICAPHGRSPLRERGLGSAVEVVVAAAGEEEEVVVVRLGKLYFSSTFSMAALLNRPFG